SEPATALCPGTRRNALCNAADVFPVARDRPGRPTISALQKKGVPADDGSRPKMDPTEGTRSTGCITMLHGIRLKCGDSLENRHARPRTRPACGPIVASRLDRLRTKRGMTMRRSE